MKRFFTYAAVIGFLSFGVFDAPACELDGGCVKSERRIIKTTSGPETVQDEEHIKKWDSRSGLKIKEGCAENAGKLLDVWAKVAKFFNLV